ncbi:sterol desaturase family protein [Thalassorhabdomicrobium marinisediminis]|uniref:sterol desaturase family protein n=1 Tax=Thalassorhabdomicrobium marinisediminis TaxID=2170577 RepID=UPI0024933678|nr:sterol desaturase family protein [Thalassorhabdomicrobium marinisediminis]
MEQVLEILSRGLGFEDILSPPYVLSFIGIAWLVYLLRRERGGFLRWLFPADLWRHRSTSADVWLFVIGRGLAMAGVVSRFGVTPLVATWVAEQVSHGAGLMPQLGPTALALLIFVVVDFANYWVHRIFHRMQVLWPLHAVHHSAEVLTPLTAYRQHPAATIVNAVLSTMILGGVLGLFVGVVTPDTPLAQIVGVNAFVVVANLTLANFHHAHIWLSFGPILERLIISPAQHHIHHSIEPRHYNRNYGQFLALWDWMFGTLYIVRKHEVMTFGLSGAADAPLMTHRLGPLLFNPLRRMWRPTR